MSELPARAAPVGAALEAPAVGERPAAAHCRSAGSVRTGVTPSAADDGIDDRALVTRLRAGETQPLQELHSRHVRSVYWVARHLIGDPATAEELTQDAFVLLWRKARHVELTGVSALPWLLATVRYLAMNERRSQVRRSRHETQPPDDATAPGSVEDQAIAAAQLARVEATIAALPPADRDVYRLCVVDGLTYQQAARRLATSHAAVRNRLARVRASLRKEMES